MGNVEISGLFQFATTLLLGDVDQLVRQSLMRQSQIVHKVKFMI